MGITEVDATGAATDTWEGTPSSLSMPNIGPHSLVPDLLSPGLSHHGLEPRLVASLRGGLIDCILRVGIDPVSGHIRVGIDPVSGHIRAGIGYLKGLTLVLTWTTMCLTLGSVGKPATRDPLGTLSRSPP